MNPQDDAHAQKEADRAHRSEVGRMLARIRWGDAADQEADGDD